MEYIYIYYSYDGSEYELQTGNDGKVLANIVYEASADGINWIQAINDNGKTVIKGLVANNQYTIRSRFGSIICTNSQQVTMESAEQLENGNFESVWNKKEINGGNGSWSRPLYCYYLTGWNTRNERTTKGGESATGWGTGVGYGVWWRWCSGTVPTADSSKDANAVEISTLAFYNKKSVALGAEMKYILIPGITEQHMQVTFSQAHLIKTPIHTH